MDQFDCVADFFRSRCRSRHFNDLFLSMFVDVDFLLRVCSDAIFIQRVERVRTLFEPEQGIPDEEVWLGLALFNRRRARNMLPICRHICCRELGARRV